MWKVKLKMVQSVDREIIGSNFSGSSKRKLDLLLPWQLRPRRGEKFKWWINIHTLWDPMDYKIHVILKARILEWVSFPFSRGFFQPRDQIQVSCIVGKFFTSWATREAPIFTRENKKKLLRIGEQTNNKGTWWIKRDQSF